MSKREFLAAVDLTDEAEEVLAAAQELTDRLAGNLTVMTVVRPLNMAYGDIGMASVATNAIEFETAAVEQSEVQLAKLASEYGVAPDDCKVVLGSPAAEIRRVAEEIGTEIIVIGTHGRHGLGLILGSTANSVLHGVPCDVLVVRIHSGEE